MVGGAKVDGRGEVRGLNRSVNISLWEIRLALSRGSLGCDWLVGWEEWSETLGEPGKAAMGWCSAPYLSSRSSLSWRPWGRVSSSMPQRTPIRVCISLVTPSILATCKDTQRVD